MPRKLRCQPSSHCRPTPEGTQPGQLTAAHAQPRAQRIKAEGGDHQSRQGIPLTRVKPAQVQGKPIRKGMIQRTKEIEHHTLGAHTEGL